ncbi:2-succinyl-6-hydroxy-2,4-cyclohexadiene-1-carboxylate synthase [Andreprevotia sp. IGB-42]|uniref:alpha/beta hydrolase n=1 Tax=Andreprevotia sp. IGB-42 TaxID=2497473 RepID=UPI00135ADE87|nr:alpha/beta fold hydrolase [Andreprevotia sp. IGB-42]KAF0814460.1 2-succinyl-6-hydroxy-2,4-cyclohexadiene-1-carboxylate synthase [Andreprevotia sp. IGB-42]
MSRELEVLHHPPTGAAQDAPPLLFVHGGYTGAWCWDAHFLPWFAERGFDAYAVSLSGHGGSAGRERLDYLGLHDFKADVMQVMGDLPRAPILVGHSLGGYLVQAIARQMPVPGIALLASVPPSGLAGSISYMGFTAPHLLWGLGRHQFEHPLSSRLPEFDLVLMRELLFSDEIDSALIRDFAALTQPESMRALTELLIPHPFQALGVAGVPALVIGVERDRVIPSGDVWATARAWRTEPQFFSHTGHALMIDTGWERIAARIAQWVTAGMPPSTGEQHG